MEIKTLFVLMLVILAFQGLACPYGCSSCTTNSCDSCQIGFFNSNFNVSSQIMCIECPPGCSQCELNIEGIPVCSSCKLDWNLDQANSKCFQCDPICQECSLNPKNCTSCQPPKLLVASKRGQGNTCVRDKFCIEGCVSCKGTQLFHEMQQNNRKIDQMEVQDNVTCQKCQKGKFLLGKMCLLCPYPNIQCEFNTEEIWDNVVQPFWNQTFEYLEIFLSNPRNTISMEIPDLQTFSDTDIPQWIQYFAFQQLLKSKTRQFNRTELIAVSLPLFNALSTKTPNKRQALNNLFKEITGKQTDMKSFSKDLNMRLAKLAMPTSCAETFYLNSTTQTCEKCQKGCKICTENACITCMQGLFFNGTICTPCDTSCKSCDAAGPLSCMSCRPPAVLTGNSCIICAPQCLTCNPSNTSECIQCKKPFSMTPDNGQCFRCEQDSCIDCSSTNSSICNRCAPGFLLMEGKCNRCHQNCISCLTTRLQSCIQCRPGYSSVNGTCQPCQRGCKKCLQKDLQICLQCHKGTFLNQTEKKCVKCEDGCIECNQFGCVQFGKGLTIFGDKIVKCGHGCSECNPENPRQCMNCKQRYYLDEITSSCMSCPPGCISCNNSTSCIQCGIGTYLNVQGNCSRCSFNCYKCDSNGICLECAKGYNLIENQCYSGCEKGCLDCSESDQSQCFVCRPGSALTQNNTCVKCMRECSGTCDPKNISMCLSCANGFELVENKCKPCPEGCDQCLQGSCSSCFAGYKLQERSVRGKEVFLCSQKCNYPCKICTGSQCNICEDGFKKENGHCIPDISCNDTCDYCLPGSFQNINGSCQLCAVKDCSECQISGQCFQCFDGFYINQLRSQCLKCSSQCKTCFNQEDCIICSEGYYKQVMQMGQQEDILGNQCKLCSPNCLSCIEKPNRCLTCHPGFRLKGNRCVNRFTVEFKMLIDEDYDDFMANSKSETLIQNIAAGLEKEQDDFSIVKLERGSVNIQISYSSTGQNDAEQISSRSNVNAISGVNIISSSVSIYYQDSAQKQDKQQEMKKKPKIGMIIGIIAGVFAVGVIAGFIIYKVKNASHNEHNKVSEQGSETPSVNADAFKRSPENLQSPMNQHQQISGNIYNLKSNFA